LKFFSYAIPVSQCNKVLEFELLKTEAVTRNGNKVVLFDSVSEMAMLSHNIIELFSQISDGVFLLGWPD
jgi:hypothetical protein